MFFVKRKKATQIQEHKEKTIAEDDPADGTTVSPYPFVLYTVPLHSGECDVLL